MTVIKRVNITHAQSIKFDAFEAFLFLSTYLFALIIHQQIIKSEMFLISSLPSLNIAKYVWILVLEKKYFSVNFSKCFKFYCSVFLS